MNHFVSLLQILDKLLISVQYSNRYQLNLLQTNTGGTIMKKHDEQTIQASIAPMKALWDKFEKANKALTVELRLVSRYHNRHGVMGERIVFHDMKVRKITIGAVYERDMFEELRIRWDEETNAYTLCGASKNKSCETKKIQFIPDREVAFILKAVVLGWSTERLYTEIGSE